MAQPGAAVPQAVYLQMVTLAMVIICVVAIALSRQPSSLEAAAVTQSSDVAAVPQPAALALAPTAAPVAAPNVAPQAVGALAAKAAALKSEKTRIAEAPSPTAAVAAIDEALGNEDFSTSVAATEPINADPPFVAPDPAAPGTVTVTGCLEANGKNGFRLTDTEGTDAPTSRSWRSGFLRKRSTSVALVTPPDPYTLKTQVGHRIAASGQLTSRDLRVTSVQVIGARCN